MVQFFSGHLIPGTMFILLGLRWSIATSYTLAKGKGREFRSTTTVNLPFNFLWLGDRLVETLLKLFAGVYGVVAHEIEAAETRLKAEIGQNDEMGDAWSILYRTRHHTIIYTAFLVSSFVELLIYLNVHLPEKLDKAMLIITFGLEGFVFMFHMSSRSEVDAHMHLLQTVSIFSTMLFSVLEAVNDQQVLFMYGRCVFVALQGSWFYQTAFALYYPFDWPSFKWNQQSIKETPQITSYFCEHFIVILCSLIFLHLVIQRIVNGKWENGSDATIEKTKNEFIDCKIRII